MNDYLRGVPSNYMTATEVQMRKDAIFNGPEMKRLQEEIDHFGRKLLREILLNYYDCIPQGATPVVGNGMLIFSDYRAVLQDQQLPQDSDAE